MSTAAPSEPQKSAPSKPAEGEACPNCASRKPWGTASWCPDCGYYPALGGRSLRSAEEVSQDNQDAPAWEATDDGPTNIIEMIPVWGWVALGGMAAIVAANIAGRYVFPMKASLRTLVTLLEISMGLLIAAVAHGSAYLFAATRSDKFGPFDYFMKPIEIWKPTFNKLPLGARRLCFWIWGVTAMIAAVFVVGGFQFDALFDDWGFEKREKTNLVQEAVKKARKKRAGKKDLESAVKEFTGEGELEEAPPEPIETRCVILGYTTNDEDELNSVVLASAPRGRLAYVGLLSPKDIPEESREDLIRELEMVDSLEDCYLKRGVPIKKANWILPQVQCLIEHTAWTSQYRLQKPTFLKILAEEAEEKTP